MNLTSLSISYNIDSVSDIDSVSTIAHIELLILRFIGASCRVIVINCLS